MNVHDFVSEMKELLDAFEINMVKLKMEDQHMLKWVDTFGAWAEFTTEMSAVCWPPAGDEGK